MLMPLAEDDPRQIGPYQLRQRIGSGGMGVVYLAFGADGRPVALKVADARLVRDPEFRHRFRTEVEAARHIHGRSVAAVIDADTGADQPWMATEYIEGANLAAAVAEHGRLGHRTLDTLALGLADALVAIHAAGVVHRDLKPSNIILAWDGPKVIDFGIARSAESTRHTGTGVVLGTRTWMAPEQVRGERVGPAADIFAWGACVAFAATGRPPFRGDGVEAVSIQIMIGEPDLLGVPRHVAPVVAQALAKDPGSRPNATELATLLAGGAPTGSADDMDVAGKAGGTGIAGVAGVAGIAGMAGEAGDGHVADSAHFGRESAGKDAVRHEAEHLPPAREAGRVDGPHAAPAPGAGMPPRRRAAAAAFAVAAGTALLLAGAAVAVYMFVRVGGTAATPPAPPATHSPGPAPSTQEEPTADPSQQPPPQPQPDSTPTPHSEPQPEPDQEGGGEGDPEGRPVPEDPQANCGIHTVWDAEAFVKRSGMAYVSDNRGYDAGRSLNVLIGLAEESPGVSVERAFFFVGDCFVGNDTGDPSSRMTLVKVSSSSDPTVVLGYKLYAPGDSLCCPSGGTAEVTFTRDGDKVVLAEGSMIPPASPTAPLSRRWYNQNP